MSCDLSRREKEILVLARNLYNGKRKVFTERISSILWENVPRKKDIKILEKKLKDSWDNIEKWWLLVKQFLKKYGLGEIDYLNIFYVIKWWYILSVEKIGDFTEVEDINILEIKRVIVNLVRKWIKNIVMWNQIGKNFKYDNIVFLPLNNFFVDNLNQEFLVIRLRESLKDYEKFYLLINLIFLIVGRRLKELVDIRKTEVLKQWIIDELTQVYERWKIEDIIMEHLTWNNDMILMVDLDDFKKINDTFGHQVGDEVLRLFAKAIVSSLRASIDAVGRYGGEEFIVLFNWNTLQNINPERLIKMFLERWNLTLNRLLKESNLPYQIKKQWISFSWWVVLFEEMNESIKLSKEYVLKALINKADSRLYEAKWRWKGRIVLHNWKEILLPWK